MENIDKIFYINLEKRKDRLEQIETELKNYNLFDKAERFIAINEDNGAVGCMRSHLEVLKIAKERNYTNILILEDDFTFLVSKEEFEFNLKLFFKSQIDFNILMLSYNLLNSAPILDKPFIQKVLEAQTTASYIVNNNFYDKLINLWENAIPLLISTGEHWNYCCDRCWKLLQPMNNWFCFTTRIGKQRGSYSDTSNCYLDLGM